MNMSNINIFRNLTNLDNDNTPVDWQNENTGNAHGH
jgi:hypothetical protein